MTFLVILGIVLLVIGLIGVLAPFLPGVPLAWLGMMLYAYGTHFRIISKTAVLVFFVLSVLSIALEFILPLLGAKSYKASKQGMIGAMIGLIVGPILFNVVGLILGPLVGAIIGEFLAGKHKDPLKAGWGVFVGFMLSLVLKFVLVLTMIGYVIVFAIIR